MRVSIYKRGRVWWARWRKDGRQHRVSFETGNRKIAEEKRIRLEHQLLTGEFEEEPAPERVSVQQLVEEYAAWSHTQKKPKTVLNDEARIQAFRDFAKPQFVDEITTKSVMDYQTHRAKKSPATRLREREILHAMMVYAVRVGYVGRNPVSNVPRPRVPQREPRFLRVNEIDELLAAVAGDRIAPLVAVAVYAGLRREEN